MDLENIKSFYNSLAENYHLIFKDWESTIDSQAAVIDKLINNKGKDNKNSVLDCACGIGTQSLGLTKLGYNVTGSDLSKNAVERANLESLKRNLKSKFFEADFCNLSKTFNQKFDIIIAMDNALPHMLKEEDFLNALKSIYGQLNENGLFLASFRDYDEILKTKPKSSEPRVIDTKNGRIITFQAWDWNENIYNLTQYMILDNEKLEIFKSSCAYRAYKRAEIKDMLKALNFKNIEWLMPDISGFYQPIVTARK